MGPKKPVNNNAAVVVAAVVASVVVTVLNQYQHKKPHLLKSHLQLTPSLLRLWLKRQLRFRHPLQRLLLPLRRPLRLLLQRQWLQLRLLHLLQQCLLRHRLQHPLLKRQLRLQHP